jgi:hypothetical protein
MQLLTVAPLQSRNKTCTLSCTFQSISVISSTVFQTIFWSALVITMYFVTIIISVLDGTRELCCPQWRKLLFLSLVFGIGLCFPDQHKILNTVLAFILLQNISAVLWLSSRIIDNYISGILHWGRSLSFIINVLKYTTWLLLPIKEQHV